MATRLTLSALFIFLMQAFAQQDPSRPVAAPGMDFASGFVQLRHDILAAHSTFDDVPISDIRQVNRCEAMIVTSRGATTTRWRDLGDLIVRLQNGRTLFRIPADRQVHVLSAQTGKYATGINMGLGLLDEVCGGA